MKEVDQYLNSLEPAQAEALRHIRSIALTTAPEAEEAMSYGMPGLRYKGKYLVTYAAFKDHLSVFPGSQAIENLKSQLTNYKLSKGTIQFTLENPLPGQLVKDIIRLGIQRIDAE